MTTLLTILLLLAGVHMMIMLLAAAYRYIDLWYRIRDFWPGNTIRVLILLLINGVMLNMLPDGLADAFWQGQLAYLVFHIVNYWVLRLFIDAVMVQKDK